MFPAFGPIYSALVQVHSMLVWLDKFITLVMNMFGPAGFANG